MVRGRAQYPLQILGRQGLTVFPQSNVAGVARMGISAEFAQLARADLRVMDLQVLLATKREFRESARSCPLTLALFPNTENVLRDREQIAGLVT
jgi:hypothetical protein